MRHRLLTIDVLTCVDGVDYDLSMPMIGDCRDNGVDVLVIEQIAITTGHREVGSHDFARQGMSPVIEISGARALDAGDLDRCPEESRTLHADADDAESHGITGRHFLSRGLGLRLQENRSRAN